MADGYPRPAAGTPGTTLFVEAARDFVRLAERVSDVRARIPMVPTEPRSPQHDADEPPFPASTLAALRSPYRRGSPNLSQKTPERANALPSACQPPNTVRQEIEATRVG
jgi:hypothetical protein